MRVNRGSGPRGTTGTGGTTGPNKVGGAKFAQMVGAANAAEDSTEKARQVRTLLLEELTGLAKDVKDGKATKEEATRKFVHLVIREKLHGNVNGAGQKALEDSVSDMCENDPNFVGRLHNELLKMARS
jgi:hypothetical protein